MASAFDPSAFIAAEKRELSQALAAPASDWSWASATPKTAEISTFPPVADTAVATIAALAGVGARNVPWDAAVRDFVTRSSLDNVRGDYWDELLAEVASLHERWSEQAYALGWTALDLFGCNPDPAAWRVDRDGLVLSVTRMLTPVRIVGLFERHASLQCWSGPNLRFVLPRAPGAVHLWEAYGMMSGP